MTHTSAHHPDMAALATMVGRAGRALVAFAVERRSGRGESGWYVRTGEADALTESSRYLENVNVNEVLGANFGNAVEAVLDVNQKPAMTGRERLTQVRAAYRAKNASAAK
jgi:hypothetical protein